MLLRIVGHTLPGYGCGVSPQKPEGHVNIHVGVQRKNRPDELLGLTSGTAASASWDLDVTAAQTAAGFDLKGPYISGPPGGRFVYLSWGDINADGGFEMFRRAKLLADGIPADVMADAVRRSVLVGRLSLSDSRGKPICAAVRPPLIEWTAADV